METRYFHLRTWDLSSFYCGNWTSGRVGLAVLDPPIRAVSVTETKYAKKKRFDPETQKGVRCVLLDSVRSEANRMEDEVPV